MATPKIIEETNKLSGVNATQLGYINGLTSDAQTQLNAKQATIDASNKLSADLLSAGSTNELYTATEKTKLNGIAEGATKVEVPSSTPASSTDAQYLTVSGTNYKFGGSASSVTVTLTAASWSSGAQTVSVTGMTATSVGTFGLATTATSAQYTAAAEAQLLVTGQAAGTITVTAYGTVPTVDIPCVVNIVG